MYRMVSFPCGEYGSGEREIQDTISFIVPISGDAATLNLHNLLALCFPEFSVKSNMRTPRTWECPPIERVKWILPWNMNGELAKLLLRF